MFGDIGKMLALAGKIKKELPALKEKLAATEFSAEAVGPCGSGDHTGAVSAIVNGRMQLVDVKIAPGLLADPDMSADVLADRIKAAVAAAQAKAAEASAQALKELTGGVELPGLEGLSP